MTIAAGGETGPRPRPVSPTIPLKMSKLSFSRARKFLVRAYAFRGEDPL